MQVAAARAGLEELVDRGGKASEEEQQASVHQGGEASEMEQQAMVEKGCPGLTDMAPGMRKLHDVAISMPEPH